MTGWIELLAKRIALPPGEWRIAARGFGHVEGHDPGPYGVIGGALLLRPTETPEHEFLLIHTNALPVRGGWGEPAACTDGVALFADAPETRNGHNACSFVTPIRLGKLMRLRLPALADAQVARLLPPWALVAVFRASDSSDVVEMWYGIAPRQPDPVGWFRDAAAMDAPHRALVARLGEWTERARRVALTGLRDPAPQVPAMPSLRFAASDLQGQPPEQQISTLRLAFYKLATIQAFESALTFALATGVSANPYIGALQTFWQGWTHGLLFVGSELAWEEPSATPVMRFVSAQPTVGTADLMHDSAAMSSMALAMQGGPLPMRALADSSQSDGDVVARGAPFAVDDKQVPLPSGNWRVLARGSESKTTGTVLGRIEDNSLVGVVVLHTNPDRLDAIFGTSGECLRSDVAFAAIRYDTPEDGYCSYGKILVLDQNGTENPLWQVALERLRSAGVVLPTSVWMVGARARTRENFVDACYYFAADPTTLRAGQEDTSLGSDAAAALQAWADLVQAPMELGVRGRLPASRAEVPWPWQTSAVAIATIGQTRGKIEALAAYGALDGAEAAHQLELADAAMAQREQQRWSLWKRSAYKTATFRIVSNIDTFGVSWFVTGSPAQSVTYTVLNQVFRPMLLYINEIGWAHSNVGKAPASLLPVTFAEIGRDRP